MPCHVLFSDLNLTRCTAATPTQVTRLLPADERAALGVDGALNALSGAAALRCNAYADAAWRAAAAAYERAAQPAEAKAAERLREHLRVAGGSPQQLLREFQRYHALIARPAAARELVSEREALLAQLGAQVYHIFHTCTN